MHATEWKYMSRTRETEENRGKRRITVSLGADVSEGYVLRYEPKEGDPEVMMPDAAYPAADMRRDEVQTVACPPSQPRKGVQQGMMMHHAEQFGFTVMTLGLETPQQLGERLAAQVIATLDERDEQPDRIACDLYPKFPTTYAAEVLAEHYQVPMLRMQKCHRAILDAVEDSAQSDAAGALNARSAVLGICLDDLSYGSDGTLWGGEILEISGEGFTRLASIHPYQLIGTNMELHSSTPWQTAVSMLYDLARMSHNEDEAIRDFVAKQEASEKVHLLDLCSLNDARAQYIAQDRNKNTTRSTAASGLFDAAAAILGFQRISTPTGRTAMEALTEAAEAFEQQAASARNEDQAAHAVHTNVKHAELSANEEAPAAQCETDGCAERARTSIVLRGKYQSQIDALYAKLEKLIAAAEEMEDPTLEPGDLWEDTDDGAFSETSADDSQDILHTEQLIRLLADERIRYLTSLGKRNYDHPLCLKHPDAGSADDNSRLLAWFLLDALATIFVKYGRNRADSDIVFAGNDRRSGSDGEPGILNKRFEEKLKLARGPVVW